jgi:hypothetical protein
MNMKKNALLAAMGVVMALTAVTGASAETRFDRTHPARAEVNGRLVHQNHRIRDERMVGKISVIKAERLHRREHLIRVQERHFARHHGGRLTRAEKLRLNHEENRAGRHIG